MASKPSRIEAQVRYRKRLIIFDDWKVGPRNASSDPYFAGDDMHIGAGSGDHDIVFYLDSEGKLAWSPDPIWVKCGTCPNSQSSDPQITDAVVDPVAGTLTITDTPTSQGELHYRLNFIKNGNPNSCKSWDPIIIHD